MKDCSTTWLAEAFMKYLLPFVTPQFFDSESLHSLNISELSALGASVAKNMMSSSFRFTLDITGLITVGDLNMLYDEFSTLQVNITAHNIGVSSMYNFQLLAIKSISRYTRFNNKPSNVLGSFCVIHYFLQLLD